MIKPDKHSDPNYSIVNVSSLILECLMKHEVLSYDDLMDLIIQSLSNKIKNVYQYALSFLFVVGKIEYLQDIDAFRMIQ